MGERQYLNKLSAGSRKTSAMRAASSTVIIFDWDDTLLCTTAIRNQQCCAAELEELADKVECILRTAMGLAETIIVTNGRESWIEESAELYLPQLLPVLSQLELVSARALYESSYPDDPVQWKIEAFKSLLTDRGHVCPEASLNLVALGDQFPEIEAARNVGRLLGDTALVKTVKLSEFPSAGELLGQLCRLERDLQEIVNDQESGSRMLKSSGMRSLESELSSRACGWRCVTAEDDVWHFSNAFGLRDMWQPCN